MENYKFKVGDKVLYKGKETVIAACHKFSCSNDIGYIVEYNDGWASGSIGYIIIEGSLEDDKNYHYADISDIMLINSSEKLTKLPDTWQVLRTKDNYNIINAWFKRNGYGTPYDYNYHIRISGEDNYSTCREPCIGIPVITFEEFQQWVLKETPKLATQEETKVETNNKWWEDLKKGDVVKCIANKNNYMSREIGENYVISKDFDGYIRWGVSFVSDCYNEWELVSKASDVKIEEKESLAGRYLKVVNETGINHYLCHNGDYLKFVGSKGDTVEATALKIKDRSSNALNAQISNLKGDTMDFTEAVDNAKEDLERATLNYGSETFDKTSYIQKLLSCKNFLTNVEENLEQHLETIKFLEERLALINS
jgi:hypothetical protein